MIAAGLEEAADTLDSGLMRLIFPTCPTRLYLQLKLPHREWCAFGPCVPRRVFWGSQSHGAALRVPADRLLPGPVSTSLTLVLIVVSCPYLRAIPSSRLPQPIPGHGMYRGTFLMNLDPDFYAAYLDSVTIPLAPYYGSWGQAGAAALGGNNISLTEPTQQKYICNLGITRNQLQAIVIHTSACHVQVQWAHYWADPITRVIQHRLVLGDHLLQSAPVHPHLATHLA